MRPAFSSPRQAAAFALLLLLLLLAPALAGKKLLPPREEIYSSIWWDSGDFPYMDDQFFREKGDMDIVFMGSSHIWAAFDTPHVQRELSKELGRPAVVRTFGWGVAGYDEVYFVAQDLLEHRKVRMLVIYNDVNKLDELQPFVWRVFRWGDNARALDGLPVSFKAAYYFASIAGMPRNLLGLLRSNLPADLNAASYWEIKLDAPNLVTQLGATTPRLGFHDSLDWVPEPFVKYQPQTGIQPSDVFVYSSSTKTNFAFSSTGLPAMQLHFAKQLGVLAQVHGCKLVVVHIPTFDERHSNVISEPVFWADVLPGQIKMIGIPPATLFKGLSDDDIKKLFSNPAHLNANGQNYFTSLMTPTLLKIYESEIQNP
jgi:hypothetical protein